MLGFALYAPDILTIEPIFVWITSIPLAYIITIRVAHPILCHRRIMRWANKECEHELPGGGTRNLCLLCLQKIQERTRRAEIQNSADRLKQNEVERLRHQRYRNIKSLFALSPQAFEDVIADLFRRMGYTVDQTPYTNDRGLDAKATKDGRSYLIECKKYAVKRGIGRRDLQIFDSAIRETGAHEGFLVTTGRKKKTAEEFISNKPITIIDGSRLISLIERFYPEEGEAGSYQVMCKECGEIVKRMVAQPQIRVLCSKGHLVEATITHESIEDPLIQRSSPKIIKCRRCKSPMRIIHGKYGPFWGCKRYPRCTYTRRTS